jgi:microcystin-dependent protein
MSSPFLGEIRAWACNFAPRTWAFCQGQILSISQNTALFALLGTNYGGNGTTNFALPDLRGRVPMHYGQSPSGEVYSLGEVAGTETITLISTTMPIHTHQFVGQSASGAHNANTQDGAALGTNRQGASFYATVTSTTPINPGTLSVYQGGNQGHSNLQPYQAINWCIALQGIFPARN